MATKNTKQGGFAHIVIVLVLAVGLAAIGVFTVYQIKHAQKVSKERALYAAADKETQDYINTIAAKYPGKIEHNTSCSYSSAKYSKGSLGCDLKSTITINIPEDNQKALIDFADTEQKSLPWDFAYDNTKQNLATGFDNLIKIRVYKTDSLTCSVVYKHPQSSNAGTDTKDSVQIVSSCEGNALAEYY